MQTNSLRILIAVTLAAAAGCASTQRPVLYPNATFERVGPAQAERDIDDCTRRAESHGLTPTGNTRVARRSAEGAAVGAAAGATAGAVRGGFEAADPNPTYRSFVQRCLRERGYDVIGWQ